jgi:uncharacterized membrane protein YphA (DoxX/SURF4 family)
LLGGYFVMSGVKHFLNLNGYTGYAQSKGVPMAKIAVIATGVILLLGGVGILAGIYTQIVVLALAVFLLITTFMMHRYWTITDPMQRMGENVNFYKNLALMGAILMMLPWGDIPALDLWKLLTATL